MRKTVAAVLLTVAVGCAGGGGAYKRMADGRNWTTANLAVETAGSYCYDGAAENCRRYGRLYTWEAAVRACPQLGTGWRLPSNAEWRELATRYGGIREEAADKGRAAFEALLAGGSSGFEAVYGGGRSESGEYARKDAHGFYWTATESDAGYAWFYNLGKGGQSVNRHRDGEKGSAFAVRCVRD